MKLFVMMLFILLPVIQTHAKITKANLALPKSTGESTNSRKIFIEYTAPQTNSKLPILLLGPGVIRGLLSSDLFIESIIKQGFGFVAMHFSSHPHSIAALEVKQAPYFSKNDFSLEDYAFEIEYVGAWAQKKFKTQVVPISLSFSGAPSSLLKSFPLIIDIAPLTSIADSKPSLDLYYQSLKMANFFNPFGKAIIRAAMDQSYAYVWRPQAEQVVVDYSFDSDYTDFIFEGYMTSSRALEDFSWESSKTPKKTKRVFIFAENEEPSLLEGQFRVFNKYVENTQTTACYFVRDSGHSVPFSKPKLTAQIIKKILTEPSAQPFKDKQGCYDVKDSKTFDYINPTDFNTVFNHQTF